ncbi:carbohydrate porin [Prosthecobacter sp.]|jgi:porin|uniref:carbohydrate porin n=1 Tax=Prosthecobacter sp. TaxID=1965333 RepID=UPI0025D324E0|nr:carbohydrate porin [Prosthecobacter sp.]
MKRLSSCLLTAFACLASPAPAEQAVSGGVKRNEDGIAATIAIRDHDWSHSREQWQQRRTAWMEALRLDIALSYDSLAIGAVGRNDGWGASSGDGTLNLRWQINPDASKAPLSLNLRVRHRHAYSDLAPSQLRKETGALWGHVDGFTNAGFQVPEIFLEDKFFDQRLTLRYGQMTIDDLLDGHQMRSAKRSFMNQAFSSSPAVGFPGSDLGAVVRWESRAGWDVTLAASHLDSTNLSESAEWKFRGGALFTAAQLGYNFKGWECRPARVQLLAWNSDAMPEFNLQPGRGVSLTLEQQLAGRTHSFFRYAWADGEAAVTDHFAVAGVAFDLRKSDRLGLSIAAGSSSADSNGWESVVEVFYRRQISKTLHITPDVQFVAGDGVGGHADWIIIGGVRASFAF